MLVDAVKPSRFALARSLILLATPIYSLLVIRQTGLPRWDAPWIPTAGGTPSFRVWMIALAIIHWVDGLWLFPWLVRRKSMRSAAEHGDQAAGRLFARFLVRLSLFHGAAVFGAAASFQSHDPRYAIVLAVPSMLMILFLPTPNLTA
jgi:hypothetical protein